MPPGSQASGPAELVREKSGLLSGAISLRERVAAEKEGSGSAVGPGDDTKREPSIEAFAEADLAHPGREGGGDTRQDHAPKAEPADFCGLSGRMGTSLTYRHF